MRAVVLSGGGAKGAYEAGVWKALRKLKIKYDIVTGTSIGAINGMMMVQKDFYTCMKMWKNINFEQLYDDFEYTEDLKEIYKSYMKRIIDGGIDTHKIEKIINNNYKSYKMYGTKTLFGIVSYNLTKREVVNSTNRNTRPNKLKKYILASATCFPVFKPTKIGNDVYIDGGYYDNLPLNLAVELGADEIIAVDLGAVGLKKKMKSKDVKVTYIRPQQKLEAFYMFESNAAKKMINLGFNDTMKTFGKFDGVNYTFKKGCIYYQTQKYRNRLIEYFEKLDMSPSIIKKLKKEDDYMMEIIEDALEIFEAPLDKTYTTITIKKYLLKKLIETEEINDLSLDELKKIFNKASITRYIYTKLKKGDTIGILANLFSKEFVTAVYLILGS